MPSESRHICEWIGCSARVAYDYASDPEHLPDWARGLGSAVERVDDCWFVETPMGRVGFAFVSRNELGVLDHEVTVPSGEVFYNPMRVVPDGEGCEVVFTLRRQAGMSDEEFERDAAAVAADLASLKRLLESGGSEPRVADFGDGEAGDHPAAAAVDPNAVYALGRSSGESDRLYRQADELRPESEALVERAGLGAGDRAIDVGCGPRGILDLLAERVSPGGLVVGLDADAAHVALAAEFVASRALDHVELVLADARDSGIESGSFDLVHARTLLVNLPEPLEALTEMVRLARPGGWVVGIEPDVESALCYPPLPAFDRLCELFAAVFSRNGADPYFGRRMADLYRRAGLEDVTVEASAVLYPHGHSRRTIRADLVQSLRPRILEMGLAHESELDELDAAARTHFDDPDTVVMPGLMFLGWGRKPTTA